MPSVWASLDSADKLCRMPDEYYAGEVTTEQRFIERAFKKIFKNWHDPDIQNLAPKLQPLKYISSEVAGNNTID